MATLIRKTFSDQKRREMTNQIISKGWHKDTIKEVLDYMENYERNNGELFL